MRRREEAAQRGGPYRCDARPAGRARGWPWRGLLQLGVAAAGIAALVAAALLHDHAASRCAPTASPTDVSALAPCVAPVLDHQEKP